MMLLFFEKFGCLIKKPKMFVLLCSLYILGLISFLAVIFSNYAQLNLIWENLGYIQKLSSKTLPLRVMEDNLLQKYKCCKNNYLETNLENLDLLQKEKKLLQDYQSLPLELSDKKTEDRLNFISGNQNRLKFIQENIRLTKLFKQSDETLSHPLQIDLNDLKTILNAIEYPKENSFPPQLIISNLALHKKDEKLFTLNMKILKREFIKDKNLEPFNESH